MEFAGRSPYRHDRFHKLMELTLSTTTVSSPPSPETISPPPVVTVPSPPAPVATKMAATPVEPVVTPTSPSASRAQRTRAATASAAPKEESERARRKKKANDIALALRNLHWPNVTPEQLWLLDGNRGGFSQVPRTLSLFTSVIKHAVKEKTKKSSAAGNTYLVLWLHIYGQGVAKIDNETDAAFEAGYGGERGKSTFRSHMLVLKDLGFIDFGAGPRGEMQYVLMLNPYMVLKKLLKEKLVEKKYYAAILERLHTSGSGKELKEADDGEE